mmetsp:Transcript_18615/g.60557  ORF Transcript_18615/g.60557 Transcript_18615/m.60557 type:complete len:165 (-) Transcript_18615:866-1360(-)
MFYLMDERGLTETAAQDVVMSEFPDVFDGAHERSSLHPPSGVDPGQWYGMITRLEAADETNDETKQQDIAFLHSFLVTLMLVCFGTFCSSPMIFAIAYLSSVQIAYAFVFTKLVASWLLQKHVHRRFLDWAQTQMGSEMPYLQVALRGPSTTPSSMSAFAQPCM